MARGVDFSCVKCSPSALEFGRLTLEGLGVDSDDRDRHLRRTCASATPSGSKCSRPRGIYAGLDHLHREPVPQPLREPKRRAAALNPEADELVNDPNSG